MNRSGVPENILKNFKVLINNDLQDKSQLSDLLSQLFNAINHNGIAWQSQCNFSEEFVEIIASSSALSLAIVCVTWLGQLIGQQKLPTLREQSLMQLIDWIRCNLQGSDDASMWNALSLLVQAHPDNALLCMENLFDPQNSKFIHRWAWCTKADHISEDDRSAIANCLDTILGCILDKNLSITQMEIIQSLGNAITAMHYNVQDTSSISLQNTIFLMRSITLLNKIVTVCPQYAKEHAPDLLGIAKMYMQYGIATKMGLIQKVHASQQSIYDSADDSQISDLEKQSRSSGGKILKTRKPRAVVKATNQHSHIASSEKTKESMSIFDIKTSDSEMSETEAISGSNSTPSRYQCSRIRLASITLLGLVAKAQERRVLYGYWHALFPNGTGGGARDDLLLVAQQDPNTRCRCLALQIVSQLILGSKDFLNQAETSTSRSPTAFLPFAISLGYMIVSTYDALTSILATESCLNVLTQALRSLAVLIQATPFHRLRERLVPKFVDHVRLLIAHEEPNIQLPALMVMEFLIARPELTPEIYEALGCPHFAKCRPQEGNHADINDTFFELEPGEALSDDVKNMLTLSEQSVTACTFAKSAGNNNSWLLWFILKNLRSGENTQKASVPVRVECLQILAALAVHFDLLTDHLENIGIVLQQTLEDPLSDIRLCAARCFDSCVYQMGRHLVDNRGQCPRELGRCDQFWSRLLPTVMRHIDSAQNEISALKVSLCDALSNVGVVIFERFPSTVKMNLFSFLSGVSSDTSEDLVVCTAAVRALAVFILFPSLRGNLVFVENAAELMLRLVGNSNLLVRIKVFWSIGNVSDALLDNYTERVSDDLLRRLIESATTACGDNDKVRCNAVRTLGNLLRLFNEQQFAHARNRDIFLRAIKKLIECISSVGNAKVKWNSCYAIGNLMHNRAIFAATKIYPDLNWQQALYSALCHVIVHHSNFKVRINATVALTHVEDRAFYGSYFEKCWSSLLIAIEQSHNLHNFYEYNHRDNLQEQLCLAISHMLAYAALDDFVMLKTRLVERIEIVQSTWKRVINRMLPEKTAPLMSTSVLLQERIKENPSIAPEQRNAITFMSHVFAE